MNFTIASIPRNFDRASNEWKDGDALFIRCSAWRGFAEQITGTLARGSRGIASGRLTRRTYQDRESNNRTSIEFEVDEIGASLRYLTAAPTRPTPGESKRNQVWFHTHFNGEWSAPETNDSHEGAQGVRVPVNPVYGDGTSF